MGGAQRILWRELADLTYTLLNHEETEFKLERLVRSRTFNQFPDEGDEENGLQLITKTKANIKMRTPPAEAAWKAKVQSVTPIKKTGLFCHAVLS